MPDLLTRFAAAAALALSLIAPPAHADEAGGLLAQPGLGFSLPPGFEATLFHEGVALQRHIAVSSEGVVFAIRRERVGRTGMVAMIDDNGDGVADRSAEFGRFAGSGIAVRRDADGQEWLYASNTTEVWRWALAPGGLAPEGRPQRIARGFPRQFEHPYKPMAFDGEGGMYVMVGAPSNACMERRRTKGSPGRNPCPQLERGAGVWRFDADAQNQLQGQAEHYATGVRNMIAFTWSDTHGALFGVNHGRDFLNRYFPELFTPEDGAELPSEQFQRIDRGDDLGWPYAYYDHIAGEHRINPEYESEDTPNRGRNVTTDYRAPLIGFPGHWGPSDIAFYEATEGDALFPDDYRGGAFLVFKGGWGRNPAPPQQGFKVVFVPMNEGAPSAPWSIFADGFAGPEAPISQNDARFHPFGVAVGPQGELFLSDAKDGVMWRITYTGRVIDNAEIAAAPAPVDAERAARETKMATAQLAFPAGAEVYARECATCHQANGLGVTGFAPALAGSAILAADPDTLIGYTLLGAQGGPWANIMPAYLDENVSDDALAAALNYARVAFLTDDAEPLALGAEQITAIRADLEADRDTP